MERFFIKSLIIIFCLSGSLIFSEVAKSCAANSDYEDVSLEGYLQAYVDMHYGKYGVIVRVEDDKVTLHNLPKDEAVVRKVVDLVESVRKVKVVKKIYKHEGKADDARPVNKKSWMFSCPLFPSNIADLRQINYSIAVRAFDKRIFKGRGIAVSLGDTFSIVRWNNIYGREGDLEFGVATGIWSIFDTGRGADIADLINTDFRVGLFLSYAINRWAFRLHIHHTSSHLGDEYILEQGILLDPDFRKNLSREAIDFFVSYKMNEFIRIYAGLGFFLHSDASFKTKQMYAEYGIEGHITQFYNYYQKVTIEPFLAIHFRNWQDLDWRFDITYAFGFEWKNIHSSFRKFRAYIEVHDGFSLEGQFSRFREKYIAAKISYGF